MRSRNVDKDYYFKNLRLRNCRLCLILQLINVIVILLTLFSYNYHVKMLDFPFISPIWIELSLWKVYAHSRCDQTRLFKSNVGNEENFLPNKICRTVIDALNDKSIFNAAIEMCAPNYQTLASFGQLCLIFNGIFFSSLVAVIFLILSLAALLMAAVLTLKFIIKAPINKIRVTIIGLHIFSSVFVLGGSFLYYYLGEDINLPLQNWTTLAYAPQNSTSLAFGFYFFVASGLFTSIIAVIVPTFISPDLLKVNEDMLIEKNKRIEKVGDTNYIKISRSIADSDEFYVIDEEINDDNISDYADEVTQSYLNFKI